MFIVWPKGLLDGNFKEHGATEVDLSDSIEDNETLSVILDYIYTGINPRFLFGEV